MMTFPSECLVIRNQEMSRYVVFVQGYGCGCIATGATPAEADEKAERWTTENLKRAGLLGKIGTLDRELALLCAALASLSTSLE